MNEDALKARLKIIALQKGETFNQVWKQLLLERFLARLANSAYQAQFVFKGGLLLARYLTIGRETIDIDFSLENLHAIKENIEKVIQEIINVQLSDDMIFFIR